MSKRNVSDLQIAVRKPRHFIWWARLKQNAPSGGLKQTAADQKGHKVKREGRCREQTDSN